MELCVIQKQMMVFQNLTPINCKDEQCNFPVTLDKWGLQNGVPSTDSKTISHDSHSPVIRILYSLHLLFHFFCVCTGEEIGWNSPELLFCICSYSSWTEMSHHHLSAEQQTSEIIPLPLTQRQNQFPSTTFFFSNLHRRKRLNVELQHSRQHNKTALQLRKLVFDNIKWSPGNKKCFPFFLSSWEKFPAGFSVGDDPSCT